LWRLFPVFFRGHGSSHRVWNNRVGGGHHLACYSIGFLFVLVISGTDGQLSPKLKDLAVRCEALGLN
jgi:hypothetical protein